MEKAIAIQKEVQKILGTEDVYLVGGSVRDLVMGNVPKDYDFTTSMLPSEMIEKVRVAGRRVYAIGQKFGTIGFKVIAHDVQSRGYERPMEYEYVEVTTFRSEVYTSKSRKPEVEFVASLDEDLARRDFTFNCMILKSNGDIYDPYAGRLDIYQKLIKTVGKPKDRIQEDPLRLLRAARFAARYDFDIDHNFIGKSKQLADSIYNVSVERWVDELDKILVSNNPYKGLSELDKMGVLIKILPEIYVDGTPLIRDTQGISDADQAWAYLLRYTGETYRKKEDNGNLRSNDRLTRYMNGGICSRLKFSNKRRDIILGIKWKIN